MTSLSNITLGLIFSLSAVSLPVSLNAAVTCSKVFADNSVIKIQPLPKQDLYSAEFSTYEGTNALAFRKFLEVKSKFPEGSVNPRLQKAIESLVQEEQISAIHQNLARILDLVNNKILNGTDKDFASLLAESAQEYLKTKMSQSDAESRASVLKSSEMTKGKLKKALGFMTHNQSLANLVGPEGIHKISPDSLVGRYIALAKERTGIDVAHTVTSFKKGTGYKGRGEEKLVVAVSPETEPILIELMKNNPEYLMHNHGSQQGTLYLWQGDKTYSYAGGYANDKAALQTGFLYPVITLSSYEASNALNYFQLGKLDRKRSKLPWIFRYQDPVTMKVENYCRTGGYLSCTHWFGEMPIGQIFVDTYTFPGKQTDDPFSNTEADDQSEGLRSAPVGRISHIFERQDGSLTAVGSTTRVDRLTRLVWGEKKGHQQMWQMLGDTDGQALNAGEWANPGWVVTVMITRTRVDRVPVVFIGLENASAKITKRVLDTFMKENVSRQ